MNLGSTARINADAGTLNLNKTAATAVAGNLTITGGSAVLQANNQIADTSILTFNGTGPRLLHSAPATKLELYVANADGSDVHVYFEAEIAILENFVKGTLGEGNTFNWTNPYNGNPAVYRFKEGWSSVKLKWFANDLWTVSMDLELMP